MNSSSKKPGSSFEKSSPKTAAEIKAACEKMKTSHSSKIQVDCNGNHIWLKMGIKKPDFWSPMLHVELEKSSNNQTQIKGKYGKNPFLWLTFLILRIVSAAFFIGAALLSWYKWNSGWPFNPELRIMFAMVSVWFALYFISEWNKKRGARQIAELRDFMEHMTD